MIEVLTFFKALNSDEWISSLWNQLDQIRKKRKEELEKINDIMFGDPLELAKYYVEPDCQEMNPAYLGAEDEWVAKRPVMVKINQFFGQRSDHYGNNQLFILSDAGMGKSALLCMLKLMHLMRFWPQDRDCVLKKLGTETLNEISSIKNRRETILLLDSLDEDPETYGRVKDRLMEILEASQQFAKVIITCRTQFFPPSDHDPLESPGQVCFGPYRCYAKYLSFFNDEKVYRYLSKRFPEKYFGLLSDRQEIEDARKIITCMGSLRCRPMLLANIEDLMEVQCETAGESEYDIYNALVGSWLRRELTQKKHLHIEDLHDACLILAVWMQSHKRRQISETELDRLIERIAKVKTVTQIDMQGRALLNRNAEGDYRFSHYSIQEFCVAKFISEKPLYQPGDKIPITHRTLKMIGEMGSKHVDLESIDFSLILQKENSAKTPKTIKKKLGMQFVYIPQGAFKMGSPDTEPDRQNDEALHSVILSRGFYMQTTPVTQKQWEAITGHNPSRFKGNGEHPVENVTWHEVQEFKEKLNQREGRRIFALPSEAQWEYACRAGNETCYYTGRSEADLDRAGWYGKNSGGTTHPVGQKAPNGFGLYDMHGNVWEWCQDWYGDYGEASTILDPCGPPNGSYRVIRGGSWLYPAEGCRSASRNGFGPGDRGDYVGFRLVLRPGQPG